MINTETDFMGLTLKNPVIVASSKLTSTVENIVQCEKAGAAAVIVKSLFEEQINADQKEMLNEMDSSIHTDAWDFFQASSENYFLDQYLTLIEDAQKAVSIPVIPSVNCTSAGNWIEYAVRFQEIGAPALELNLFIMPSDATVSSTDIEKQYVEICSEVKKRLTIPVSVKLGFYFSGMAQIIKKLSDEVGMDALVLFNRFYRPDINIEKMKLMTGKIFTDSSEMALSLQWIALMSGEIKADLAANTGVHSGEDLIKQLLVGAKAVEVCSVLYNNGFDQIQLMVNELHDWMERHEFGNISEFCGLLCQERSSDPAKYERAQYIKVLTGIH